VHTLVSDQIEDCPLDAIVIGDCCNRLRRRLQIQLRATPAPLNGAETKRAEFPRFYFVSDPTLLEILSLGSDPPSVVPHFQSGLFDSLTNVTFDKVDKTRMTEMFSQQAERVRAHNMKGFPGWFRIKA
jgi:hypothetical protein